VIHLLWQPRSETYLFALEIALLAIPMVLLFRRKVHNGRVALYASSILTLLGFVANRMNVAITGMQASAGVTYFPKWTELAITMSLVAAAFTAFWYAVKYLPVFPVSPAEAARTIAARPALGTAVLSHAGD
jgi:Ni/Fe-hydrogenase subunit HybB-like protein